MIARKTTVLATKKGSFTNEAGKDISFYQIIAEDDKRLYLLSAKTDIPVGTDIDIAYDGKKYSVIEYA